MIKSLKATAIALTVLGLLFCIIGMIFSNLAEQNRGAKVSTGYMKNGEFISTNTGRVGANKKGEESATAMATISYIGGGLCLIGGLILWVRHGKESTAEVIRQNGTIIEKTTSNNMANYVIVSVEFADGTRKRLFVEPPLIVAQGDYGLIGYKRSSLVEFTKTPHA